MIDETYKKVEELVSALNLSTEIKLEIILNYWPITVNNKKSLTPTDWCFIRSVMRNVAETDEETRSKFIKGFDKETKYRAMGRYATIELKRIRDESE